MDTVDLEVKSGIRAYSAMLKAKRQLAIITSNKFEPYEIIVSFFYCFLFCCRIELLEYKTSLVMLSYIRIY